MHADAQPEIFQGRGGFVKLGHFHKFFIKSRIKSSTWKNFTILSPKYLWNYILNEKFNSKMDAILAFFSKIMGIFSIFNKGQGRPPHLPL